MKTLIGKLRSYALGFIIWVFYRLMVWSWKIELHEPERLKEHLKNNTPYILAHFHGDEAPLLYLASRYKLSTMISTSKDGELMNVVYTLLGGKASRGSSTRGGVSALKGLLELAKKGRGCNISVDGPKGPIYEVKPGVFELSRLLKAEIFSGGAYCEDCWKFPKSWNQAYFPKPFARVVIVWAGPFGPITKGDDPRSPELAKTLQNQLFAARQQAANLFGVSKA
ncbi:MAG: lysophospholipid acyltransferase family protein [Pseudobdellovibrio sp.]